MTAFVHGRTVFLHLPRAGDLTKETRQLLGLAAGRPVGAELCDEWSKEAFVSALQRLGDDRPKRDRLWIKFLSPEEGPAQARRFAGTLNDQQLVVGSNWLIVDPVLGRKRVAVLAYRQDAYVTALDAEHVNVTGYFWRPPPPPQKGRKAENVPMPAVETLQAELRSQGEFLHDARAERRHDYNDGISVAVVTAEPARVLSAMEVVAGAYGLSLWPDVSDPEPVHAMLRRLRADVDQG
jgi:hypothetical protein